MSFSHVVARTTPLAVRPFAAWNVLTSSTVVAPNNAVDDGWDAVLAEEALDALSPAAIADALGREARRDGGGSGRGRREQEDRETEWNEVADRCVHDRDASPSHHAAARGARRDAADRRRPLWAGADRTR